MEVVSRDGYLGRIRVDLCAVGTFSRQAKVICIDMCAAKGKKLICSLTSLQLKILVSCVDTNAVYVGHWCRVAGLGIDFTISEHSITMGSAAGSTAGIRMQRQPN